MVNTPYTCKDQMGREVIFHNYPPKRIVSLVPSQTELLHDLGLSNEVVGVTKFCIHPKQWHNEKTKVGGTKKISYEKIKQLKPDLIIGNKEENEQEQIENLTTNYNVWMSNITTINHATEMIENIGNIVNKPSKALEITSQLKNNFAKLSEQSANYPRLSVLYFIWNNPFMVAGDNTFINDVLNKCNLKNMSVDKEGRYPEYSVEEIKKAKPDIIFLSSEPFPFQEKHIRELQKIVPQTKIILVDGEMFSWYGSRLLQTTGYIKKLFTIIHAA